jgi:DNA anti-recombination protein RmuC
MVASLEIWFLSLPVITQVIIAIISVLTISMLGPLYNNRTLAYGPTILTMLGIFGCFLGISIGLMHFQTNDIQASVPELLNGIKTAFWASVAGVGGALVIKARHLLFGPPRIAADGAVAEATVDDLALLLRTLNQSLAGKEDSTLLSQTKLLRQENRDGLASLKNSLDSYMEKIADSNSKALIEALKEVIRDFNAKINEQFGDNFKQLNSAVEKLLLWQNTYRQQVTEIIEQQKITTSTMSEATAHYKETVANSECFSNAANSLVSLIKTLELQREQITHSLTSLGSLLKSAGDNLPKIESQVVAMIQQVESGVRSSNAQISSTVTTMTQNLQTSHSEMKKLLIEAAEASNKDVNTHIKQLSENTQKQVVALDKALSDELTKSIETLGEHLTALSRRFVEDYSPLTDKLRTLVQTAGRA